MSGSSSHSSSNLPPSKKRKRADKTFEEIQVNVSAPEPASKKALRKAKKGKDASKSIANPPLVPDDGSAPVRTPNGTETNAAPPQSPPTPSTPQRSQYGIWIGNLPFTATKETLTTFFTSNVESITPEDMTRVHLPGPSASSQAQRRFDKPQNRGFAYIDFAAADAQKAALALSETLFSGRRVLIKDAQSFEGRPQAGKSDGKHADKGETGNPPNKRIFVGNMDFDTTEDDLQQHFSRCGEVVSAFTATFEDSGKCKGYGWVTFGQVEEAERAVRGWVELDAESDGEEDEADKGPNKKKRKQKKPRRWWVNRLKGRALRMEFAEDSGVRYRKRYSKGKKGEEAGDGAPEQMPEDGQQAVEAPEGPMGDGVDSRKRPRMPTEKRRSVDARTIKSGAANSVAPRQTAGIVDGQGKKITFE
ncbi:MAG: hypothetical protein LQ340_006857 [Diploschistes diacapsis]|nr:MAG: hypothetical protein LQ340_006857 [Diploschistes diacapsis]